MNLFDANAQHQMFMQQMSESAADDVDKFLRRAKRYLTARLSDEGETIVSKKRLARLLSDVKKQLGVIYGERDTEFVATLNDLITDEIEFQESTFTALDFEPVIPTQQQAITAINARPVIVNGSTVKYTNLVTSWTPTQIAAVQQTIENGFYYGWTIEQISKELIGTKAFSYKNGDLGRAKVAARRDARTAINHLSTMTKDRFYRDNQDIVIGYEIVATLDSSTSDTCKGYDGNIYYYKDGYNQPKPPFHPNCRTGTSPSLDPKYDIETKGKRASVGAAGGKQVGENVTYYDWLATQPAAFQDKALGSRKTGLIFRNAGLNAKEFKAVTTDAMGQPIPRTEYQKQNRKIAGYLKDSKTAAA